MKFINYIIAFILIGVCASSCNIFSDSKIVNFECQIEKYEYIDPPEYTHKCKIELLEFCNINDSIIILSNDKVQKSSSFVTTQKGTVFYSDWYVGTLGILYKPNSSNNSKNQNNDLKFKVTFYTTENLF